MNPQRLTHEELTILARFQLTTYGRLREDVTEELVSRMEQVILPTLDAIEQLTHGAKRDNLATKKARNTQ